MEIKILTASGYAVPHFANGPVLSVMTTPSLNQKPIRGGREKMKIKTEILNSLLALNLFSLRVLPVFFRQLSQTNLLRKKKYQRFSINPLLVSLNPMFEHAI